jgi:hypothetical protein
MMVLGEKTPLALSQTGDIQAEEPHILSDGFITHKSKPLSFGIKNNNYSR